MAKVPTKIKWWLKFKLISFLKLVGNFVRSRCMDISLKIVDGFAAATQVADSEVEKLEQPEVKGNAPVIESVTASGNQLVSPKRLCPEKPLDERYASVGSESVALKSASDGSSVSILEDETIKRSIDLAIDILVDPKKTNGFKYGNELLGKKASKSKLSKAIKRLENAITPENLHNINPVKNLVEQAHGLVKKELNAELAVTVAKVGISALTGVAGIVTTAVTLGASAPITVPAIIAAGAAIAKTVADSSKSIAATIEE
jgi:hypothetical protein